MLYPISEGLNLSTITNTFDTLITKPIKILFLDEIFEKAIIDIEFDGVVASSDCFDVPFDVIIFLDLLDVVKVDYHKEGDEDSETA